MQEEKNVRYKKYVPVEVLVVDEFIPTGFIECGGRYIPTKYIPIKKYLFRFEEFKIFDDKKND